MLGRIIKHPLRFEKGLSVDRKDCIILKLIRDSKDLGTIELSESLKIAPKNLLSRLQKLENQGYLLKEKTSLEPKGWKRKWVITDKGKEIIKSFETLEQELQKNK